MTQQRSGNASRMRGDGGQHAVPLLRQPPEVPGVRQHLQRKAEGGGSRRRRAAARSARSPPALRLFDAGMGDATVLARLMRSAHASWPAVPQLVVAKEISREDVRLGLEKMADRFLEHPTTVLVVTNLHYADAPALRPRNAGGRRRASTGRCCGSRATPRTSTRGRSTGWVRCSTTAGPRGPAKRSGNPVYVRPSVLVIYREDHAFLLDAVIPRPGIAADRLRLHPRLTTLAGAHVGAVQGGQGAAAAGAAPRTRRPAAGRSSRAATIPDSRSCARCGPARSPFQVDRHKLLAELRNVRSGADAAQLLDARSARQRSASSATRCTRCPPRSATASAPRCCSPPGTRPSTSTRSKTSGSAKWSRTAGISTPRRRVLRRHGGLWFNDESFVVSRRG